MENNRLDRDYENEFPLKSFLEVLNSLALVPNLCLCLILAFFIYLRYTVPEYEATATILVKMR
jgi:capsular polysaccharide biosynthesis protein